MKSMIVGILGVIFVIILTLPTYSASSLEQANQTYFNSETYYDNYQDLVSNYFLSKFNTMENKTERMKE